MFIGEQEIKSIQGEVVTFTDDTTAEFSESFIEYIKSEEPKDLDQLHIERNLKMQSDILKVFVDANASKTEISQVMGDAAASIARAEKNILCDMMGVKNYLDLGFRKINTFAKDLNEENFTN